MKWKFDIALFNQNPYLLPTHLPTRLLAYTYLPHIYSVGGGT